MYANKREKREKQTVKGGEDSKTRSKRADYYKYENMMKGVANHRRAEIMFLLNKHEPLSTDEVVEKLQINYQTGAVHVQRLVKSGLIYAYRQGQSVLHELTNNGKEIIRLLIKL